MKSGIRNLRTLTYLGIGTFSYFLLVIVHPIQAEIRNCGGTWTNQACPDSTPLAILDEVESPPSPVEDPIQQSRKRSALHDLITKNINAKKENGIGVDTSEVERSCLDQTTELKSCLSQITEVEDRLLKRISDQRQLSAQERSNQLAEERLKSEDQRPKVIVIQNYDWPATTPMPDGTPPLVDHHSLSGKIEGSGGSISGSITRRTVREQRRK